MASSLKSRLQAKIEPQLHLRVPQRAGVYGNDSRWSNEDLDPVPVEKRTWGAVDYWSYWCSDLLAPPLASTVGSVMSLGFTAKETIPIVFFGFGICSIVVHFNGKMGAMYSVSFPVIMRSIFGMYGATAPILVRAFVAAMWHAILTVQGGDYVSNCITAIWPSFAHFPNHLSPNAGITSAGLLCFFIFWIGQTILAVMGIEKLRVLFWVKAVVVPPTFFALFLWGAIVTHGGGPLVTGPTIMTSTYMNKAFSALTALNAIIGLFSSLSVNMPDFGRFSKNNLKGGHQFFALPIIGTLGALGPIFATSANQAQHGVFTWYMPDIIAAFDSRAAKFFCGASFILATVANQIAADTYPFSNDFSGLFPRYLNIFRATLIVSVFSVVVTPWNIIKNASGFLSFLSGYSCFMGPLAGVMIVDFWVIKKTKVNIHELYRSHGIYHYSHGINWRAIIAWVFGFAPLMPGFIKACSGNTINVGNAWQVYTLAWTFGILTSMAVYYIICTWISPQTESLIDVAVLPPQRGDVEAPFMLEGVDTGYGYAEKAAVDVDTKKVGTNAGSSLSE